MSSPTLTNRDNYEIGKIIGSGSFGTVYQIKVKGQKDFYAMKEISLKKTELSEAKNEYDILKKKLKNVVPAFGSYHDQSENKFKFSMEYFPRNLSDYIESLAHQNKKPTFAEFSIIFLDIITGLYELYKVKSFHRDLKPENILLNENGRAYLGDLGVAKSFQNSINHSIQTIAGTEPWMAPEMLSPNNYNSFFKSDIIKLDIFSLGMISLFCLDYDEFKKYKNLNQDPKLLFDTYLKQFKGRIPNDDGFSLNFYYLLRNMLSFDPTTRPSIEEIFSDFVKMQAIHDDTKNLISYLQNEILLLENKINSKEFSGENQGRIKGTQIYDIEINAKRDSDMMNSSNLETFTQKNLKPPYIRPNFGETLLHFRDPPVICNVNGNNREIDMKANLEEMMKVVNQFLKANGLEGKAKSDDVINFIKSLQPQHRCNMDIFKKVLAHAALMSRSKLVEFSTNKKAKILSQIEASPLINKILEERKQKGSNKFSKWVVGYVDGQLAEIKDGFVSVWDKQRDSVKKEFTQIFGDDNVKQIETEIDNIIDISNKVQPMGIGYNVDNELKTDQFVFCTVGPNRGFYYGEIIIFLSPDIMYHPDFNMTPVSGVSFMNRAGSEGVTNNFKHRPWSKSQCPSDKPNNTYSREVLINLFHRSKITAAIPGWVELFAAELVAKTFIKDKGSDPLEFHNIVDSNFTFEGHMPEMISFSYVEKIAMSKRIFQSLTPTEIERLNIFLRGEKKLMLFDEPHEDIIKKVASEKFFKEIKHDSCKGFEFTVEKLYGHSFAIPLKMKASTYKSYNIQFEAIGWDIHLSFSKSTQSTKNNPNQKEFLHLIFDNIYSYSADPKKSKTNNSCFTLAGTNNVKESEYTQQDFVNKIEVNKVPYDQRFEYTIIIKYDYDGLNLVAKKINFIDEISNILQSKIET